jgi:NADH dehydrogenase [ubiquinone] 1 alpha subcomplex assembly factor 1
MAVGEQTNLRLEDLQWRNRVVLVFPGEDIDRQELAAQFERERAGIEDRDIRYFVFGPEVLSNGPTFDPEYASQLRARFARPGRNTSVALIGKDGGLKYEAEHLDLEAVFREIDAMPMRRQEMSRSRRTVVDFSNPGAIEGWATVDDVVMGGVSDSRMTLTGNGTALFQGTVSLEHGGGFASVRKRGVDADLSGYEGLVIRIRGDGGKYQLRVRTDDQYDGISYRYVFVTEQGRWMTVRAPFAAFEPVFKGRRVEDAPPLDPGKVRQIGFLIAHKQEGTFRLEIESIEAYRREDRE